MRLEKITIDLVISSQNANYSQEKFTEVTHNWWLKNLLFMKRVVVNVLSVYAFSQNNFRPDHLLLNYVLGSWPYGAKRCYEI